jgi:hypothetical protein
MLIDRRDFLNATLAVLTVPGSASAASPPYRIPINLTDTRVLVDCMIGSRGPYSFVFDTGGTIGLIELELAKQLKLKQIGSSVLGLKQGKKSYPIYLVPDLTFGNQVRQPVSTIAGVETVNFREGAVGSIAAGALTAANCELDFDAKEWRIYRDVTPDRSGWTRFPGGIFHFGNRNGSAFIAAEATLNGQSFRFGLDTGMPSMMRIYRKTAEKTGLWNAPRWSPTAPKGKGRMTRSSLTLAGVTLEGVIVTIIDDAEWAAFPNGIIGLPILRQFNMATVAKEELLLLKRNGIGASPERYNRAGMWVDRVGTDARIGVVGLGSPAEKAGLKAGDRLIDVQFDKLIDEMFEPAGYEIALTVDQAGVHRQIKLLLEDYL